MQGFFNELLATKLTTLDEESLIDALKAAYRLIDDVADALEKDQAIAGDSRSGPRVPQSKKGSR